MGKSLLPLAIAALTLLGCSSSKEGELDKKDEKALRNNFSRNLSPEEIAHMNNAKPVAPPSKGK